MKIDGHEILCADAGYCNTYFLKLRTDEGLIGWSEFGEHTGTLGLSAVVDKLCELITGMDALRIERVAALLHGRTIQARDGVNQQAIAAIVNALLDIKGKALGVPVHALFGGTVRDRIPVYWSHSVAYRMMYPELMERPRVRTLDDVARVGEEARNRGIKALKTGMVRMEGDQLFTVSQGFSSGPGFPELNLDPDALRALVKMTAALREGCGPDVDIMLDVNCHFQTEGFVRLARAVAEFDLLWLELDIFDPQALAAIRRAASCPIASLEAIYGRAGLRPYFELDAVDVAIIDVVWNGYLEAIRMADFAAAYKINIAPHLYSGGGLGDVMSTHFAAAVPNLRIMEFDFDEVPWKKTFLSAPLQLDAGEVMVPTGPGWGTEVDEAVVRAHPPR